MIAAGAVVTPRTIVPPGSLVMGTPAKIVRTLSEGEQRALRGWAEKYLDVAKAHATREAQPPHRRTHE
jgi:carbonic anhydrase/acetyltransferase-like protein (isoleucine patch superfamily)